MITFWFSNGRRRNLFEFLELFWIFIWHVQNEYTKTYFSNLAQLCFEYFYIWGDFYNTFYHSEWFCIASKCNKWGKLQGKKWKSSEAKVSIGFTVFYTISTLISEIYLWNILSGSLSYLRVIYVVQTLHFPKN